MAHTNTAVTTPQTQSETKQLVSWRFTAVYSHSRHLGFSSWGGRGLPFETLQMRRSVQFDKLRKSLAANFLDILSLVHTLVLKKNIRTKHGKPRLGYVFTS